jgi:ubiquinol-cytochrome c reductase cytochrome c subunit
MHHISRFLPLFSLQLALAVVSASVFSGGAMAADAAKGKVAFVKNGCYQCHGYVGQGGQAGARLAPKPLPFEALVNFVRTTNRQMPPYSEQILSDSDLADIHAYLETIPVGPDPKTIPLLNQP